ncbi:MAG: 5-formyltetrahydrofolate cyclo-ligase [Mycobacterium sp.]|nr:5-formyltetrahydrofolate cyclo-ligase [Mycobacterium sp.]
MAVRGNGTYCPEIPDVVIRDTIVGAQAASLNNLGAVHDTVTTVTGSSKAQRRAELLAARREVPESVREAEAASLCAHLAEATAGARTVCAYLPVGTEPGSPAMVDLLQELCDEVLLPVVRSGTHAALLWGRYVAGALVTGRFGLREPAGPWLPADSVARAAVVLVPALAVDRSGVRLGRGGGFYDRTLTLCRPGARLVAVVRDCEVIDAVPAEAHDVRMTHALTPDAGLIVLGESPGRGTGT